MITQAPLTVSDLKQWAYCPRVVFYGRVMSGVGRATWKMQEGKQAEDMFERLEVRRKLAKYELEGAERRFRVWMSDEELGLSGKADLLLCGSREVAAVDFKLTSGEPGANHRMQLAAYSMLAERMTGLPARRMFVYRIPDSRLFEMAFGEHERNAVLAAARDICAMSASQALPNATAVRGRCVDCEYQNYCGDVW
jgi:CRISPR-associated exonuclease Cas4